MDRRKRVADAYRRGRDGVPPSLGTQADGAGTGAGGAGAGGADETPVTGGGEPARGEAAEPGDTGFDMTTAPPMTRRAVPSDAVTRELTGSGPERAARLLLALGTDRAAQILRHLDEAQVEAITAALMALKTVHRSELDAALGVVREGIVDAPVRGGPDVARGMLVAAFGEDAGGRMFFRAIPNAPAHHFAFLNELEPAQLHSVVKEEPDAAAALVLAHVDRSLAAKTLALLPVGRRAEVARRIARMGQLSHDVVVRVEDAVREKIRRQGRQITQGVDGVATVAAILRHLAPSDGDAILGQLRKADVDLSESIREKLYTAEMVASLTDRHLADLMRDFSDQEIALFLKGKDLSLRERVLRSLSQRRGESVSEEYAHLGAQRRDDVERVTGEVLNRLRELEEDGSILVPREGDRYI